MSRRVFLHVGLPKTGTSALQARLWRDRDALREAGLLLPGREKRDHLLSTLIVREDPGIRRRGPGANQAWAAVRSDVSAFAGDALISHEFFCAASERQARRTVDQLAPAEVHLVLTAREPLGLFTSSWQESLKNLGTAPMAAYARSVSEDPREVWNWRALDLGLVLDRWGPTVPADRVHVVTLPPPGSSREELWRRFCSVLGLDPGGAGPARAFANESMGLAQAETLRRVNLALTGPWSAGDRGRWLRSHLADRRLVPQGGDRFWPAEDRIEECRTRGRRAVDLVRERGYHVVGELDSLLVPETLPQRRRADSVTEDEVAAVAVTLVARLLEDLRDRSAAPQPTPAPSRRTVRNRLRALLHRP